MKFLQVPEHNSTSTISTVTSTTMSNVKKCSNSAQNNFKIHATTNSKEFLNDFTSLKKKKKKKVNI